MTIEPNPKQGEGANRGDAFHDYIFGNVTCNGKERYAEPVDVFGTPHAVFSALAREYARYSSNPITTFNLNFAEHLGIATVRAIISRVDAVICAGLHDAEIIRLGAVHWECSENEKQRPTQPIDDPAKTITTNAHIGYVNTLVSSGRRWQPYWEGADRGVFVALTEILNYDFHLASAKDPGRERDVICIPIPGDSPAVRSFKEDIEYRLRQAQQFRELECQRDARLLVATMDGVRNVVANREGLEVFPSLGRPFEVKGKIVQSDERRAATEREKSLYHDRKLREEYWLDLVRWIGGREERHRRLRRAKKRFQLPFHFSDSDLLPAHVIDMPVFSQDAPIDAVEVLTAPVTCALKHETGRKPELAAPWRTLLFR